MAEMHLGPAFEIHGGGLDLVFPHHENEIAQSRGAGREFARIWMHNGMLRFGGEKMSKSVGNVVTLEDAVEEWGPETLLMLFLGAHWRKPMDYSDETLAAARARADGLREVFRNPSEPGGSWDDLVRVLEDDFNTPEALAVMHGWRDHDLLRRCARPLRARLARGGAGGARRAARARPATRRGPGRAATTTKPTDCARKSRTPAGKCATSPATRATSSSRSDDRGGGVRLRPPAGPRGPPRPARGTGALGDRAGLSRRAMAPGGTSWCQAPGQGRTGADRKGRDSRPPGRARVLRAVPVRGRLRAGGRAEPAARLPRPRDRSAQPRRRLPGRRGGGGNRRDRPGARVGPRDAGGLPGLGGGGRARPARRRAEPRPLSGGREGRGPLGLRRYGRRWEADVGDRPHRRRGLRLRRRGSRPAASRPTHVRRARLDPACGQRRIAERERRRGRPALRSARQRAHA